MTICSSLSSFSSSSLICRDWLRVGFLSHLLPIVAALLLVPSTPAHAQTNLSPSHEPEQQFHLTPTPLLRGEGSQPGRVREFQGFNARARSGESHPDLTVNLAAPPRFDPTNAVRAETIRAACLQGRRCVCGRVLKVFPTGVLVESGYPTLLRDSLHGAWHVPATVTASRPPNLVESHEPDSICVGTVFLTDLPKLRGGKKEPIAPYDYVVLHSYPAGYFTYGSIGNIQHTVRRFSGGLETAVRLIMESDSPGSRR